METSSNEGDIVLDAFRDCGAALVPAERRGCEWIGIECPQTALWSDFPLHATQLPEGVETSEKSIALTVQEILDEQIAHKLA